MTTIENIIAAAALALLLSWQWDMPPEAQALQGVANAAAQYPIFAIEDTP